MTTLSDAIKNAEHHLAIGNHEIYLSEEPYPWIYVNDVTEGGVHRMDCTTSVYVYAAHPCGITFRWNVNLEKKDANGKGFYCIDTETITITRHRLANTSAYALRKYDAYLHDCASKIEEKAEELTEYIGSQMVAIALLREATNEVD